MCSKRSRRSCRQIIAPHLLFCWQTLRQNCNCTSSIKWNSRALLQRVDLLILNDSEARQMTKETSLIRAGRKIRGYGPRYVAIKKGEHGALLFGKDEFFSAGAYPLEDIHDPTGAGDTFA